MTAILLYFPRANQPAVDEFFYKEINQNRNNSNPLEILDPAAKYCSPGATHIGADPEEVNRLTHNHPANDSYDASFTEINSMGFKSQNGKTKISGDYYNVRSGNDGKPLPYPYRVFFPGSKNLYNITPKGIKLIREN